MIKQILNILIYIIVILSGTDFYKYYFICIIIFILSCFLTAEEVYSQLSSSARKQLKIMYNQQLRILELYLKLNHPDNPELMTKVHRTCEGM